LQPEEMDKCNEKRFKTTIKKKTWKWMTPYIKEKENETWRYNVAKLKKKKRSETVRKFLVYAVDVLT